MDIFSLNYDRIVKHNLKYNEGIVTYKMGINAYTDMVAEELRIGSAKAKPNKAVILNETMFDNVSELFDFDKYNVNDIPDCLDWRTKGAVTSVKNQLPCGKILDLNPTNSIMFSKLMCLFLFLGSCYAFSAISALEGQIFINTGELVSLSAQEIVDCTKSYSNNGCDGGLILSVYQYVYDRNGLVSDESYPYDAEEGSCKLNDDMEKITTPKGNSFFLTQINEEQLKHLVAIQGPVSVGIVANIDFQHYASGVFYAPEWNEKQLNHGVTIVGYGTDDATKTDYWIVKNSFGIKWGDDGYIKMSRNRNNNCGITLHVNYPSMYKNE